VVIKGNLRMDDVDTAGCGNIFVGDQPGLGVTGSYNIITGTHTAIAGMLI
jgi:hypothetical protein